jgi:hypothetical protein
LQISDKPQTCNVVGSAPWSGLASVDSPGRYGVAQALDRSS